jgi:hypothetical protein
MFGAKGLTIAEDSSKCKKKKKKKWVNLSVFIGGVTVNRHSFVLSR